MNDYINRVGKIDNPDSIEDYIKKQIKTFNSEILSC